MNKYWKRRICAALICGMLAGCCPVSSLAEAQEAPAEATKEAAEETPKAAPEQTPTAKPTEAPTPQPTAEPTPKPTDEPTAEPTQQPTAEPAEMPEGEPTLEPTQAPSEPTDAPTAEPTDESSAEASAEAPTPQPSMESTAEPTETPEADVALMSTTLTIAKKVDLSGFDFAGYEDIVIEVGGEISGGVIDLPVENYGTISGGTYKQTVDNFDGAVIEDGCFEACVNNQEGATIKDGAFNVRLVNAGVVKDGRFIGYIPKDEADETPARTVQVENSGVIQGGEFSICKVSNDAKGEISGGSFSEEVILPNGDRAALDFEETHVKLKGGTLYYQPLKIFAMLDADEDEIVILPLNPQEALLGYSLTVVRGTEQYELTGAWAAAEDGYMHIPMAEEWRGGRALVSVGYLSSADAQEAAATAEVALPGVQLSLTAQVDYAGERLTLHTAERLPAGWKLTATLLPQAAVDYALAAEVGSGPVELEWPADADEMSCTLSELGASPDAAGDAENYGLLLQLSDGETGLSEALTLILPARADFSGKATALKGIFRGATEIELVSAEGIETALALPGTSSEQLKAGKLFSGLKENTQYYIWVRDAAVEGEVFASRWKLAAATTTQAITDVTFSPAQLTVEWQPNPAAPGITFEGGSLTASDLNYHWMNEKGESGTGVPTAVGSYQIICSLSESKAKWYRLRSDALEYNVIPLEINLANTRVRCESLTYNGSEQLPEEISVTVNGVEIPIEEFTISKISGQNYKSTGVKKLRLSGNGNVTGSIDFSYTIYTASSGSSWGSASGGSSDVNENEVEGEESGVEEIDYLSDNGERLMENYLGVDDDLSQIQIVYDVLDAPQDYELLPVYNARESGENMENALIVVAQPDADGEISFRTLRLGLDQLRRLYGECGLDLLMLRNGDGECYLPLEALFSGDVSKLTMLMLVTQADEIDPEALNFDALVETQLADEQLAQVNLELRIDPAVLPGNLDAWEITAWLCRGDLEVEVSGLLSGFTVGVNVNGLFEDGEDASFAAGHALVLVDMDAQLEGGDAEIICLESRLELMPQAAEADGDDSCAYYDVHMPTDVDPEVLADYIAQVALEPYRNYIMTAPYSGKGVCLVVSVS